MATDRDIILAGDIGGTKTLLQLVECRGGNRRALTEARFESGAYSGLEAIVREFLEAQGLRRERPGAACFGVAGPVSGGCAKITNLPWRIEADALGRAFDIPKVALINDFVAAASGIEGLVAEDLAVLQSGTAQEHGPRAVIGAGTGLGEGYLVWQGDHYRAYPSEGGHADFAPRDERQIGLLRDLTAKFGRVSYERVVSGQGLAEIYAYLRDSGAASESATLARAIEAGDPAAAVSHAALEDGDALAGLALDMFVDIYGAQAGNLALTVLATGGVYVAGGIAPKIIGKLREGGFIRAFSAKGRFSDMLAGIPVQVVLNPKVGLIGAARVADRL